MSSGTEWPAATVQYRLNLAHTLHSISPPLSALHTSRAAALHPEVSAVLQPTHCPKCGTYHFSGDQPSYLAGASARKRKRAKSQHPKALQRRCHLCSFSIDACASSSLSASVQPPSNSSRTATVPVAIRTKEIAKKSPSDVSCSTASIVQTTKVPPLPSRQLQPKPSHTKASTLKDMLSRDRQREEGVRYQKKRKEGHEGLAAFLKEL